MDPIITIFSLAVLLVSVIIHELAHGYVANSLGDPTAKYQGRLTLNPIPHLDPFGSLLLPFLLFMAGSPVMIGWAKPVPVNPYNFTDQKWGGLKVALSGPLTNIFIALVFGLLIRFVLLPAGLYGSFYRADFNPFAYIVGINLMLALFNLIPIPPLDGSWVLLRFIPDRFDHVKVFLGRYGIFILMFLIFFRGLDELGLVAGYLFHIITGV